MILNINPMNVIGLGDYEKVILQKLITIYQNHASKNAEKNRYYEGKISLNEVNLGLALPDGISKLQIG